MIDLTEKPMSNYDMSIRRVAKSCWQNAEDKGFHERDAARAMLKHHGINLE